MSDNEEEKLQIVEEEEADEGEYAEEDDGGDNQGGPRSPRKHSEDRGDETEDEGPMSATTHMTELSRTTSAASTHAPVTQQVHAPAPQVHTQHTQHPPHAPHTQVHVPSAPQPQQGPPPPQSHAQQPQGAYGVTPAQMEQMQMQMHLIAQQQHMQHMHSHHHMQQQGGEHPYHQRMEHHPAVMQGGHMDGHMIFPQSLAAMQFVRPPFPIDYSQIPGMTGMPGMMPQYLAGAFYMPYPHMTPEMQAAAAAAAAAAAGNPQQAQQPPSQVQPGQMAAPPGMMMRPGVLPPAMQPQPNVTTLPKAQTGAPGQPVPRKGGRSKNQGEEGSVPSGRKSKASSATQAAAAAPKRDEGPTPMRRLPIQSIYFGIDDKFDAYKNGIPGHFVRPSDVRAREARLPSFEELTTGKTLIKRLRIDQQIRAVAIKSALARVQTTEQAISESLQAKRKEILRGKYADQEQSLAKECDFLIEKCISHSRDILRKLKNASKELGKMDHHAVEVGKMLQEHGHEQNRKRKRGSTSQ